MPQNREAGKIYLMTRNQIIVGFDKVIDLNHLAVHAAMDLYEVKNKKECFEKVLWLFQEMRKDDEG